MIAEHTRNPDHSQAVDELALCLASLQCLALGCQRTAPMSPQASSALGSGAVEPIVVEATRGGVVEARHLAHAVAVSGGEVVASAGDPQLVTFFRSSAKPLQALPVVRARRRSRRGRDRDRLRVPSRAAGAARRRAQPAREGGGDRGRARVRPRADAARAQLLRASTPGMLALCRARGWASEGYRLPEHPLPARRCWPRSRPPRRSIPRRCRRRPTAAGSSPSRCRSSGWPTPSRASTSSTERRGSCAAMRAHPSSSAARARRTRCSCETLPGWVAKGGAEGLLCAAAPDGLGVALKVEDGSQRADRAPRSRRSSPASGSTRASSESSRSRTRAARSSERFAPFETVARMCKSDLLQMVKSD